MKILKKKKAQSFRVFEASQSLFLNCFNYHLEEKTKPVIKLFIKPMIHIVFKASSFKCNTLKQ